MKTNVHLKLEKKLNKCKLSKKLLFGCEICNCKVYNSEIKNESGEQHTSIANQNSRTLSGCESFGVLDTSPCGGLLTVF